MEGNNLLQKKKVWLWGQNGNKWIENLGETIVNSGTPLLDSKIITSTSVQDDNTTDSMNGFAVIKAENMETAIKIAKTDPFLESGDTVRVSQMMEMKLKLINFIMII